MAVIMEVIYKVSDTYKTLILILFVSVGMPSAYIIGKLADSFGYKKVLAFTCVMLVITTATFFYSSAPWILYIVATI
jgi:MFS family permease